MAGRAMGMTVDQGPDAVLAEDARNFVRRDVGDFRRLLSGLHPALLAQLACQLVAGGQGQVAEDEEGDRVAQPAAQAHVGLVLGAQAVAVHQEHGLAVHPHQARVGQEGATGFVAKCRADHEIAIAVHQEDTRAAVGQFAQGLGDRMLEGRHGVVADPGFEEVAEYVEGFGLGGAALQEMKKRPGDIRAFLFKMQIGDQQYHSMISAFSMITSSTGTSWWPPFMVVATALILFTTSMPSATSPNTA
ncbi:hypothetical protein D3C85_916720 [compost metagenome]